MTKSSLAQPDQMAIRARYDFMARWHDTAEWFATPHRCQAIQVLDAQPGECVLDLACGTGINFKNIISQLGANGQIVGLDYSPRMLAQACQRLRRHRWRNVELFLGSAAQLPFAERVFDRIICTYSLKVIPPYRQALDEVVRVLKPGGTFVVLDGKLSDGATRFLNPLIRWVARGPLSDIDRPLIEEIAQRFQNVRISEYDFGHTFVALARKK